MPVEISVLFSGENKYEKCRTAPVRAPEEFEIIIEPEQNPKGVLIL